MNIRKLSTTENPPMELLLLADPSTRLVMEYLQKGETFVAEIDDQVIGVYVLVSSEEDSIEIVNIAVNQKKQGKGIGKQLIKHAIETAERKGYSTIEIGTGNSSIGQLALYQKCGFRIIGIDRDFFTRNYSEEIYENGIQCKDMVRLTLEL